MIFGAFLERSGAGAFFMNLGTAVAGRWRGGPAKIAVLTSALFGSISGSSVANVVTTGSFTIPPMKRTGFRPHDAGAIEAIPSTGGPRSEEHTSELQSLMRISYAVFCLKYKYSQHI